MYPQTTRRKNTAQHRVLGKDAQELLLHGKHNYFLKTDMSGDFTSPL